MNETDARLQALLAPPDEFPDEIFTARVRRQVLAEGQLREIHRRSRRRFAVELAGTAAAVAVFVLLGRTGASSETVGLSPALAGLALVAFWTFVGLRPGAGMGIIH